jgi:Na+-transporting NADH:ubiquinone oxidoreductase subunit NqrD
MHSTKWFLYTKYAPLAWFHFALCVLVGIIITYCFVWISQYYTIYKYKPVHMLTLGSKIGHGTNIIANELTKICQLNASYKLPNYFGNSIFYMVENAQYFITN